MHRPRVALILDHPQRDLAGLTLLAHALCARGATCHIVPLNLQQEEVWALAPDFVVLNYARRGTDRFAQQLADARIGFGVLDTEGGVWDVPRSYSSMLWDDAALRRSVAVACMWGPRLTEHVVAEGIFSEEQIAVTGCPRFDFYHPSWQPAIAEPGSHGSRYVLVNTNFSFANPRFSTVEKNIMQLRDEIGWSHERTMEQAESEQMAIAEMIALVRSLARDVPGTRIILRPHPFENPETYRVRVADLPSVEIDVGGPVQPRIFGAAVVIQRGCSTAVESAMAQVPTLSPRWVPVPGLAPMTEAVSDACSTYDELRVKVEAILGGAYSSPPGLSEAIRAVIADWFCAVDGDSHRRAADAIIAHVPRERMVDGARCVRNLYGLRDPRGAPAGAQLSRAVRYRLRLSPEWSFRRMRPVPRLSFAESDKHFGLVQVRAVSERIGRAARQAGGSVPGVAVGLARERGELGRGYHGFSVTIAPA